MNDHLKLVEGSPPIPNLTKSFRTWSRRRLVLLVIRNSKMLGRSDSEPQIRTSIGDDDDGERFCKICYGADDVGGGEWMTPCKCLGSIKWVHKNCLTRWLKSAPGRQRSQCLMCKYEYVKVWHFKSFSQWHWPRLDLGTWDMVEIILDIYSTVKLVRNTAAAIQGTKSIVGQMFYFMFWRTFILSDRRIQFYSSLCLNCIGSVLEPSIQNVS